MTAPNPTPAPLAAVADTLKLIEGLLEKCSETLTAHQAMATNYTVETAGYRVYDALRQLENTHGVTASSDNSPALQAAVDALRASLSPVTPAPQAPEVPRRVRVVKASRLGYWYTEFIGDDLDVVGIAQTWDFDREILSYRVKHPYAVSGQYFVDIVDCEPVTPPALSAREAALVEAARLCLGFFQEKYPHWGVTPKLTSALQAYASDADGGAGAGD